jgi:hypothetical protein
VVELQGTHSQQQGVGGSLGAASSTRQAALPQSRGGGQSYGVERTSIWKLSHWDSPSCTSCACCAQASTISGYLLAGRSGEGQWAGCQAGGGRVGAAAT